MLILTRRVGEVLIIKDEVTVTVLGVKGNQVRLGAKASQEVSVHREEVYYRIQQEKNGKNENACMQYESYLIDRSYDDVEKED